MKIELDYNEKTIQIKSKVKIEDLIENVKKLLPDWKEWEIIGELPIVSVPLSPKPFEHPAYPFGWEVYCSDDNTFSV